MFKITVHGSNYVYTCEKKTAVSSFGTMFTYYYVLERTGFKGVFFVPSEISSIMEVFP